jgi:hypothetical protein
MAGENQCPGPSSKSAVVDYATYEAYDSGINLNAG